MIVLFIARSNLYSSPGGDTIQIEFTAKYLRRNAIKVDVHLSDQIVNYSAYDLIHFFNIIDPEDILKHVDLAGKPFVVSTIFVDYSEYEKKVRGGIIGLIAKFLDADTIEYLKTIAKMIIAGESLVSKRFLLLGHRRSIKYILKKSSLLLPNSHSEYKRLFKRYQIDKEYLVIPNAIDPEKFSYNHTVVDQKYKGSIICVGRIEGRKNQLNLIKSILNTQYKLYIIGDPAPNQLQYYEICKKTAAESNNIYFVNNLSQDELTVIYKSAKVHVLPSWFETTGLVSLEAAAMGCNIVVTRKGDTEEYFKDYAFYCQPDNIQSIREAIEAAFKTPYNENFRRYILENYTWEIAAKKTKEGYCKVLNEVE